MLLTSLPIGEVSAPIGSVQIGLQINAEGTGTVLVMTSRREGRKVECAAAILDKTTWASFKELVAQADATIERLKKEGKLQVMADGFRMQGE